MLLGRVRGHELVMAGQQMGEVYGRHRLGALEPRHEGCFAVACF